MIVPDQLYRVGEKALSGGLLELWTARVAQQNAAALVTVNLPTVPLDRILVLSYCCGVFTGGAAQSLAGARLDDVDALGNVVGPIWTGPAILGTPAAADGIRDDAIPIGYCLAPGHRLSLTAVYTGGANPNSTEFLVQGWMIPRGEVQFAGPAN